MKLPPSLRSDSLAIEWARSVQRQLALHVLQLALAGERPLERVLGPVLRVGRDEHAARAGDTGDARGDVDRAPVPVATAPERGPERHPGAQLREALARVV